MNRLRAAGVGAATLHDWLGEGGEPVAQALAERRASVCVKCPHNTPGNLWERLAVPAVLAIMEQRRIKAYLGMKVKGEDGLHFCDLCHCHLPTKVLVPMKHLEARTPADVWATLPDYCWLVKERGS